MNYHPAKVQSLGVFSLLLLTAKRFAVVALLAWHASTVVADKSVDIQRRGSVLDIRWYSKAPGTWTLSNQYNQICASGNINPGDNAIQLHKVSPADDLRWELKLRGDKEARAIPIDRQVSFSDLAKVDGAAIIYQLPVRTYLATERGAAHTGRLNALTDEVLGEIKELGADYVWLTGILEHASRDNQDPDVVKGEAGSFYAIYDMWDVSPQVGSITDLMDVIQRAHRIGLRVMIDFVANHTARIHRTDVACKQQLNLGNDDRRDLDFDRDNNYYYIRDSHFVPPRQGGVDGADGIYDQNIFEDGIQLEQPARVTGNDVMSARPRITDWFETAKLNYGFDLNSRSANYTPRPRTWAQMADVAKYWAALGVDGFRVDFAHSVPIEFWRYFVEELRSVQPHIFLLAEAYESDEAMRLPNFSYEGLFTAGFDSVYNSYVYWALRDQALQAGRVSAASYLHSPAGRPLFYERGFSFTHYMENHDELRLASRQFAPVLAGDTVRAAHLGRAYTAFSALLPGNFLLHGGQEVMEDASVAGPFAGDSGRTSIFDFVFQGQTRQWLQNQLSDAVKAFRHGYSQLLHLKKQAPFSLAHRRGASSFVDLMPANLAKAQSPWVSAYLRHSQDEAYIVVINSDPSNAHDVTLHFTDRDDQDRFGALSAMGIANNDARFAFVDVWSRNGWTPTDPNLPPGGGIPGHMLYKSGGVPSGLFLGSMPAASTYVLKVIKL